MSGTALLLVGRARDGLARLLLRFARNRYEAALRQKARAEARRGWETYCVGVEGWAICVRAGLIRDRDKRRCSGCGATAPSASHPIVRRAGG